MPLEDTDVIDMITSSPDGGLTLVVSDAGITEDEEKRYHLLVEKLRTYMSYCLDDEFAEQHPGVGLNRVQVLVVSRIPPSAKMAEIRELSARGARPARIPVLFKTQA